MLKKIISLILTFAMLTAFALPMFGATDTAKVYDYTICFPEYSKVEGEYYPAESFVRYTVKPGTYGINDVMLVFKDDNFDIFEYPYFRLEYRTDAESDHIDTTMVSSKGENWPSSHPRNTSGGEWTSLVMDVRTINARASVTNPTSELGVRLRFKICGNQPTVTKETHFDVKVIAFFKTRAEALAFDSDKYYAENRPTYDLEKHQILPGEEKLRELDAACDKLIEKIKSTPTSVTVTGTKYYVSASGNDANDGKTPETAWQSLSKVNDYTFEPGDGVFFKRGDFFRAKQKSLRLQSGVTYSAYGVGEKPVFVGSLSGSSPAFWSETDVPNVYKYAFSDSDIGCIVFDGGRAWGIKVTGKSDGTSVDSGYVNNGLESFYSGGKKFTGYESLENNLEFTTIGGNIYLCSKDGNPGEVFESVELSASLNGVVGSGIHDVVFDNIKLYGYGEHGIGIGNIKNVTIQNCVFGWIGGSTNRLGNAVQNWGNAENFVIDHCHSYQIYDCCYTTQHLQEGGQNITNKDVIIRNTVSEYANSGPEIWNHVTDTGREDDTSIVYDNVLVYDNFVRYNGYGWSHQRPNKDGNFYYGAYEDHPITFNNFKFYNNNFMVSSHIALLTQFIIPGTSHFNGNTYVLGLDKLFAKCNLNNGYGANLTFPYTSFSLMKLRAAGVEVDGEFYSVPENFTPPAFNYAAQNDIYSEHTYMDVKNHWGRDYIRYVSDAELFKGVSPFEFAPNGTMTRAMLFTVLSRVDEEELEDGDVWYDGAVKYAIENKLTSEENARPDEIVTRAEIALILSRFIDSNFIKAVSAEISFDDIQDIADVADSAQGESLEAVKRLVGAGIINGFDDNTFKPDNSATRAEVAAMIYRLIKYCSGAEVDIEAAKAAGELVALDADALADILTIQNGDKIATVSLYDDDGVKCARIDPVISSGTVRVDIKQSLITGADFYKQKYMIMKYKLINGENRLDVGIVGDFGQQWMSASYRTLNINEAWITGVNCYDYQTNSKLCELPFASNPTYVYTVKPWGNQSDIPEGSYFEVASIYFTGNEYIKNKLS